MQREHPPYDTRGHHLTFDRMDACHFLLMPSDVIIRMDKTSARCNLNALKAELESQRTDLENDLKGVKHGKLKYSDCCVACNHAYEQVQKALKRSI